MTARNSSLNSSRRRAINERLVRAGKADPLDWYIEACVVCGCQLGPGIGSRTPSGRCVHDEHQQHGGTVVRVVSVQEYDDVTAEVERLREALTYYAERRNHTTRSEDGEPMLWWNDSYDGQGPGARARVALGLREPTS